MKPDKYGPGPAESETSRMSDSARETAKLFRSLAAGQKPLGAEFDAAWHDDVETLYEP